MTVHKLSAGDGYRYLTRQVASADQRRGGAGLAGYYTATGTPPGRWLEAGAADLGVSGQVSERQMVALFGKGMHPDADQIVAAEQVCRRLARGLRRQASTASPPSTADIPQRQQPGAVRPALLPQDGPTGCFLSWDGTTVGW